MTDRPVQFIYHGFFSKSAREFGGSSIYLDVYGNEVEVTNVVKIKKGSKWEDEEYVGEILEWGWVRKATVGRFIWHWC